MSDTAGFRVSDWKPLQQRGALRDDRRQVRLVKPELKPMTLRKMLWRDLNAHLEIPGLIRGFRANQKIRFAGFKYCLAPQLLMQGQEATMEAKNTDSVDKRSIRPNAPARGPAVRGHVEPVAIPTIVGLRELPTVNPQLEARKVQSWRP
jgi:hypothetical protein